MITSITNRFAFVTDSMIMRVAVGCLIVAASLLRVDVAAADGEDWRWPGPPAGQCADGATAAHLDVYADGNREPLGFHRLRRCKGEAAQARVVSLVDSHFRFTKRFLLWPDIDVAVDHQRTHWRHEGKLVRIVSLSRGDAACRRLFNGECRLEFKPSAQQEDWTFSRTDAYGDWTDVAPRGTVIDDMWSSAISRAPAVANLYTGRIWRIETIERNVFGRFGEVSSDMIDGNAQNIEIDDLANRGIEVLDGIGPSNGPALTTGLTVTTVRELAL